MAGAVQLEAPVGRQSGRAGAARRGEPRLGLDHVERRRGVDGLRELLATHAEGVGQRGQDPIDLRPSRSSFSAISSLLISTVCQRLQIEAGAGRRARVDQAGDGVAVFRLHDHHVAALAVGDDLLLQVAGGVAAAQEALERRPRRRAAGGAGGRGSDAARGSRRRRPRRRRRWPCARPRSLVERRQAVGERAEAGNWRGSRRMSVRTWSIESSASARPSSRRARAARRGRTGRPACRRSPTVPAAGTRGGDRAATHLPTSRPGRPRRWSARRAARAAGAVGAEGVSAKLASASRTRENSSARRVPGCMRCSVEPGWPACQAVQPLILASFRPARGRPLGGRGGQAAQGPDEDPGRQAAAPNPLSMFMTAMPEAQLFSIASRAARPSKLAP